MNIMEDYLDNIKPYNFHDKIKVVDFVCVDPGGYSRALEYHKDTARKLNEFIDQYEVLYGRKIDAADYRALIGRDLNALKRSYSEVIEEKISQLTSPSLRDLDKKAYTKDGQEFFYSLSLVQFVTGSNAGFLQIQRIRFVDGKATFDEIDEEKLLKEEYSIDFGRPEYLDFKLLFNQFKTSYERICQHLIKNRDTMKINPMFETIVRHDDNGLISIDPVTKEMKLNNRHMHNRTWID